MDFNVLTHKRLIAAALLFFMWSGAVLAEKTSQILVVSGSNDGPYQEALRGFKEQISAQGKITLTELPLSQAQSPSAKEIDRIKPDLIYALGSDATRWASLQASRIPVVATMVLKDDVFRESSHVTGVSLNHSLSIQFQWLRKFFPQQKTVAILFNPAENAATVREASQLSQQSGFKLVAIPVESPKNLPYALDQLSNNIDVLMAIPDETVMSINTAKEVLLASFSNKVPLVGLSDNWVKSGALYSLSWDYVDIGRQSATLAQKLLGGATVKTTPPEHPRKITYTVNAKIAEHMGIDISRSLLKDAKMVFN